MMIVAHAFKLFWTAAVAWTGVVTLLRGIAGLRTGSAQLSWNRTWFDREKDPVEYWLAVSGELSVALALVPFMIWLAWGLSEQ